MKYDFTKEIDYTKIKDLDDFNKQEKAHFDTEIKKSKALPDGLQVGKLFRFQVADGYAYYQVEKIGKKSVKVKWRFDLCPDRYTDRILGSGGSFPKNMIEKVIMQEEAIYRIFAKKA
jgi:hypothetical protein